MTSIVVNGYAQSICGEDGCGEYKAGELCLRGEFGGSEIALIEVPDFASVHVVPFQSVPDRPRQINPDGPVYEMVTRNCRRRALTMPRMTSPSDTEMDRAMMREQVDRRLRRDHLGAASHTALAIGKWG